VTTKIIRKFCSKHLKLFEPRKTEPYLGVQALLFHSWEISFYRFQDERVGSVLLKQCQLQQSEVAEIPVTV
jgi:hypothetical protein